MADGTLFIGNRRYSSWSLRGWLAVHLAGLDVEERVIPFVRNGDGGTPAILETSPNGLVPYLQHREAHVFESLAILEYCAEFAPELWPGMRIARAHARSIAAEMHAGFGALRRAMPMNVARSFMGRGGTPEALRDIDRICAIWQECLDRHGGPFLYGEQFGAADAMYAPVVARFLTYSPQIPSSARVYCSEVRRLPLIERWYAEADAEPREWLLPHYENQA